ncbi:MAG: gamma-glutamylcyclotransferase [Deltaproteobacteria bacterium]
MRPIFSYGTLQVPDVMRAVTGREYVGETARLPGYAMYRVKNAEYPGILLLSDSETEGTLYSGPSEEDLKILDAFEGDFYIRRLVEVRLQDGSSTEAWVYVIREEHKDVLSDEPWRLEQFLNEGFNGFMKSYVHGRKAVYAPDEQQD